MKRVLFFLCVILSIHSFSQEKYVSTVDLSDYGQTGYQVQTYERNGNHFIRTYKESKYYCHILDENDSFLTLVESTSGYPSAFVIFIDKKTNTIFEKFLDYESDKDAKYLSRPTIGSVVRVD
tara:strand:+ start:210 stop:575 length:366 start_codon:yes stop_codon:yes gene_type:complete